MPQITAILQAGNLYVYSLNNPIAFTDRSGKSAINVVFAVIGSVAGWEFGDYVATNLGLKGAKYWVVRSAVTVGGAAVGWFAGEAISSVAKAFLISHPEALSQMPGYALRLLGMNGGESIELTNSYWGIASNGINQGYRHFFEYGAENMNRINSIAKALGKTFDLSTKGYRQFTEAALNIVNNYQQLGGEMRDLGGKAIYYYNNVIVITYNGKLQPVMKGTYEYFLKTH